VKDHNLNTPNINTSAHITIPAPFKPPKNVDNCMRYRKPKASPHTSPAGCVRTETIIYVTF